MTEAGATAMPDGVSLARVGKTFGSLRALADVSVAFAPGRIAAIVGPNGAGKSTLLGVLSTLLRPSSGTVTGIDRTDIGYVGHEPGVYADLGARANLELGAALHGAPEPARRAGEMLARVGLGDAPAEAPVRTFSRGMLQRLALGRALIHGPRLLLLDEPASALDPAGAEWLARELSAERDAGRVVVLVTHDLDAAGAVADQLVILRRGRVVLDESRQARFSPDEVRRLYRETVRA